MNDPNYPDPRSNRPATDPQFIAAGDPHAPLRPLPPTAPLRTRGRPTSKVLVIGALAAAAVALWQFGPRFGWGPGGRSGGNEQGGGTEARHMVDAPTAQTAASVQRPVTSTRPLRVRIDGTRYLVGG